jgi:hypothetical protein
MGLASHIGADKRRQAQRGRPLPDETLERKFADEQISALLVAANLAEGDGARAVTVRLLHTANRRVPLTRRLGRQVLKGLL